VNYARWRQLTTRDTLWTIRGRPRIEQLQMNFRAGSLCRAERTPDPMDIAMQLYILHLLRLYFTLPLSRSSSILTRTPKQPSPRFESVNVLGV
jgi:hypothetical protein